MTVVKPRGPAGIRYLERQERKTTSVSCIDARRASAHRDEAAHLGDRLRGAPMMRLELVLAVLLEALSGVLLYAVAACPRAHVA